MEDFAVHVRRTEGLHVLAVVGELDISTAPDLAALVPGVLAGGAPVVVDLTACTFLDSSGSRAVGMVGRDGVRAGVPVALVSPPRVRAVRRVVDHVGLAAVMAVHDSLDEALAGVRTAP